MVARGTEGLCARDACPASDGRENGRVHAIIKDKIGIEYVSEQTIKI